MEEVNRVKLVKQSEAIEPQTKYREFMEFFHISKFARVFDKNVSGVHYSMRPFFINMYPNILNLSRFL